MVSVLGLLVNVAGLLMLGGAHSHSHSHHGHAHAQNANLRGVYLHVLSDTLGSVGVVVSALLVRHLGWTAADAVCSLLISALMAVSVAPLLRQTALVLVLRAPPATTLPLRQTLSKVQRPPPPGVANHWPISGVLVHSDRERTGVDM